MGERDEFFRIRAEAFQRRCDALEKLLSCYRTGSQPSERLHRDLRRTQDALAARDSLNRLLDFGARLLRFDTEIPALEAAVAEAQRQETEAEDELHRTLTEHGVCPLCGTEFLNNA